jgi:hypothetical protein
VERGQQETSVIISDTSRTFASLDV